MDVLTEERYGDNVIVRTHWDMDPMSPREFDNLTTIRGWHRRMEIGDGPNIDSDDYNGWDDMIASIVDEHDAVMVAPLYWHEHSGVACKMGSPFTPDSPNKDAELARFRAECMDSGGWDSGVAGLVIVSRKDQANMGIPNEDVAAAARQEVETYNDYVSGQCYGYTVVIESECDHGDTHEDVVASCWGFLGDEDYAMEQGREHVAWCVVAAMVGR